MELKNTEQKYNLGVLKLEREDIYKWPSLYNEIGLKYTSKTKCRYCSYRPVHG